MTQCEFIKDGSTCKCVHCGKVWPSARDRCDNVYAACTNTEPRPANQLGDRIEHWLTSHGITEEKYKEVKGRFGLPEDCNCAERKAWFNKVGEYLGIR